MQEPAWTRTGRARFFCKHFVSSLNFAFGMARSWACAVVGDSADTFPDADSKLRPSGSISIRYDYTVTTESSLPDGRSEWDRRSRGTTGALRVPGGGQAGRCRAPDAYEKWWATRWCARCQWCSMRGARGACGRPMWAGVARKERRGRGADSSRSGHPRANSWRGAAAPSTVGKRRRSGMRPDRLETRAGAQAPGAVGIRSAMESLSVLMSLKSHVER